MIRLYTEETLIQYYYKETDLFTTLEVEYALLHDSVVRRRYNRLISNFNLLNQGKISPSKSGVSDILAYSRKSSDLVMSK